MAGRSSVVQRTAASPQLIVAAGSSFCLALASCGAFIGYLCCGGAAESGQFGNLRLGLGTTIAGKPMLAKATLNLEKRITVRH